MINAVENFRQAYREVVTGQTHPIETLWDEIPEYDDTDILIDEPIPDAPKQTFHLVALNEQSFAELKTAVGSMLNSWVEEDPAYLCCRFCHEGVAKHENSILYDTLAELHRNSTLAIEAINHGADCPALKVHNLLFVPRTTEK